MKAYTVAIPNLPLIPSKEIVKFVKWISTLDGFVAMHIAYPHGTLLLFKTLNDAKIARNRIKAYDGYEGGVSKNIGQVRIDPDDIKRNV